MPVTSISSEWVSGNLVFYETGVGQSVTGDVLTLGTAAVKVGGTSQDVDFQWYAAGGKSFILDAGAGTLVTAGIDVTIAGDLTIDLEDIQIKDNFYLQFGDATGGDVSARWVSATSLLEILPATDDIGAINIGNGTKDIDVKIFLGTTGKHVDFNVGNANVVLTGIDLKFVAATASAYFEFDENVDKLLGYGNAQVQIGESTTGVVTAGGTTMIYGYANHKTNALTGTLRGIRGNAGVYVSSASGTAIGGDFRAANGASTVATDGVDVGTLRGAASLIAGVGRAAAGPAVVSNAQGMYIQLDIDAANLTISDARGIYVNVQSGNASANTLTACNLAYLEYESVVGTAPTINSAIKIATVGGATGATYLIDAATFNLLLSDTDKVALIRFKDSADTVKILYYDISGGLVVA